MLWKLLQVLKQMSWISTASQLGPSWPGGLRHITDPTGTPWSRSLFPISFKMLMKQFVELPWDQEYCFRNSNQKASLVAQWWRICLPCWRHRFDPWSEKIPHATGQLSPCTATIEPGPRAREPQLLGLYANYQSLLALWPVFCNKRSHCNEKPVYCN